MKNQARSIQATSDTESTKEDAADPIRERYEMEGNDENMGKVCFPLPNDQELVDAPSPPPTFSRGRFRLFWGDSKTCLGYFNVNLESPEGRTFDLTFVEGTFEGTC